MQYQQRVGRRPPYTTGGLTNGHGQGCGHVNDAYQRSLHSHVPIDGHALLYTGVDGWNGTFSDGEGRTGGRERHARR